VRRRARNPARRPTRGAIARRWLAVVALAVVAFLYYRPLQTYLETRDEVARRAAEVEALQRQREALEQRLAARASTASLLREARRLGYVKPGEKLYIVKGIPEWRRAQAARSRDR
jgi:cell division protein FtsB